MAAGEEYIPLKKMTDKNESCSVCRFLEYAGTGSLTFCAKLARRVRGNNVCIKFEGRDYGERY